MLMSIGTEFFDTKFKVCQKTPSLLTLIQSQILNKYINYGNNIPKKEIWRDNKSMKRIVISIFMIFLIIFGYIYYMGTQNESVEILSKYGSSGEEVKQIQQKLKNWGYYKGNVDRDIWK